MRVLAPFLILTSGVIAFANVQQQEQGTTPIQKVVVMLNDMLAKGKTEKQEETVRFAAFKGFCENTEGSKTRSIAKNKESIETLKADIEKANADIMVLTKKISGLDADVDSFTADLQAATEQRAKEKAIFTEAHEEYVMSMEAVKSAISLIKQNTGLEARSFAQVTSLLQIKMPVLAEDQRDALVSFLKKAGPTGRSSLLQDAADMGYDSPEASAYESSSGGILDMLENLGDKFRDECDELERRETNALQAFNMASGDLTVNIKVSSDQSAKKNGLKATRSEDLAEAEGDLSDTTSSLEADEKYLADLTVECEQKSFDYAHRQEVRQGELDAINKAIEIVQSGVAGHGEKHLPGLVQQGVSLAQLRSTARTTDDRLTAAASFLERRAGQMGNRMLMLMAERASADPFVKVKKMIQNMIDKLLEEANEEASHKGFCDTEMGTNKQTRERKTEVSDNLKADIEEYTADIAKLAEEIGVLNGEVEELNAAVAKATGERMLEKSKNQQTIKDGTAAAEATARALAVLKEFYEKAAVPVEQPAPQQGGVKWDPRSLQILSTGSASASLLQSRVPGAPEMEEGGYTGMGNGGVLGMLEVIQSDFERLISETDASESDAAAEYDKFKADSDQDIAVKQADLKNKENTKTKKESDLQTADKDLRITEKELTAALDYYEKLKPSCEFDANDAYAKRAQQRNEEIQSLKEALEILAGESV